MYIHVIDMKKIFCNMSLAVVLLLASACTSTKNSGPSMAAAENLTLGTVQRSIYVGMSSSDVVSVLGSPNMVTKNETGTETWVYDKIHSQAESKQSDGFMTLILFGGSQSSSTSSRSERTLTIVIHFDTASRVSSFTYRTTTF